MHLLLQNTAETNRKARDMFERAIELDSGYAPAFAYLAYTYYLDLRWGYSDSPDDALSRLFDAVRRAVSLDNLDARRIGCSASAIRSRRNTIWR
jgi:hypothetical protein